MQNTNEIQLFLYWGNNGCH